MFEKIGQKKVFLEILEQIKLLVQEDILTKGSRLPPERQMAEELGVSRAAAREAVRALELMGVVRCVQGEGNYLVDSLDQCLVEPLSIMFMLAGGDIRQVQQLRHALEVENAKVASALVTKKQIAVLEDICFSIENEDDEQKRAQLDQNLHYQIAAIADNPLIGSVLNASANLIESLIIDIRAQIISGEKSSTIIDSQHREIVHAIKMQDEQAAFKAMDKHMQLIDKYVSKITQC